MGNNVFPVIKTLGFQHFNQKVKNDTTVLLATKASVIVENGHSIRMEPSKRILK